MDNDIISENRAWVIISEFVNDLTDLDQNSILAVYAIGSLGGGYYRPGKSDIDTIIVVKNDAVVTQEKLIELPQDIGKITISRKALAP